MTKSPDKVDRCLRCEAGILHTQHDDWRYTGLRQAKTDEQRAATIADQDAYLNCLVVGMAMGWYEDGR